MVIPSALKPLNLKKLVVKVINKDATKPIGPVNPRKRKPRLLIIPTNVKANPLAVVKFLTKASPMELIKGLKKKFIC
ncbi:hypothetical protein FZ989_05380 [Clostridium perfringens]|nr:hypothetical protein [Clostridium perfringens]